MNKHTWVLDVLDDLLQYSSLNELPRLRLAIKAACETARDEVAVPKESGSSLPDELTNSDDVLEIVDTATLSGWR